MNLKQLTLLALVFTTLLLHSCKDKDTTAPTDSGYAFNLSIDDNNTLTWESINVSNFQRYIIIRSLDSIPDDPQPPNFSQSTDRFSIGDQDEATFTDVDFPTLGDRYYKVYIELDDRFVLSPTVKVESPSKGLPFCYNHAAVIPGTNHMILSDQGGKIYKYDFVTNKILQENNINFSQGTIRIGDAGNGLEIFAFGAFSPRLFILNPDNLDTKEEKTMNGRIHDVVPSDKGFLFVTINESFDDNMISIKRSDLSVVSGASEQNGFSERKLAIFNTQPNEVYEISSTRISTHEVNNNGIITSSSTTSISANAGLKRDLSISPDGNSFIHSNRTDIYDVETLNRIETFSFLSDYHTFDQQNPDFLYFSDSNNCYKLNIPNNDVTIVMADIQTEQVFDIGDQLLLLGNAFSSTSNCTYITTVNK